MSANAELGTLLVDLKRDAARKKLLEAAKRRITFVWSDLLLWGPALLFVGLSFWTHEPFPIMSMAMFYLLGVRLDGIDRRIDALVGLIESSERPSEQRSPDA